MPMGVHSVGFAQVHFNYQNSFVKWCYFQIRDKRKDVGAIQLGSQN